MARGNQPNNSRDNRVAARRAERRAARGNSDPAEWGSADAERVVALIAAVTRENGLCSFGYTRDGGTYTVTVILDGDKSTDYCRPTEDLSVFLDNITADFT